MFVQQILTLSIGEVDLSVMKNSAWSREIYIVYIPDIRTTRMNMGSISLMIHFTSYDEIPSAIG